VKHRLRAVVTIIGVTLLVLTGLPTTTSAIIGGSPPDQSYPFIASFSVHGRQECGATLITPDIVVISAHCDGPPNTEVPQAEWSIRVGSDQSNSGGMTAGIRRIAVNPNWNIKTGIGDLALFQLDHAVPYTPSTILPWTPAPGSPVRLLGMGCRFNLNECTYQNSPPQLRQLDTVLIDSTQCSNDDVVCSAPLANGAQGCEGDSGFPMLVWGSERWWLVGEISHGNGPPGLCAHQTATTVSDALYLPWIRTTVAELDGRVPPSMTTAPPYQCGNGS
jgi:secreted trypsin-like serine protease